MSQTHLLVPVLRPSLRRGQCPERGRSPCAQLQDSCGNCLCTEDRSTLSHSCFSPNPIVINGRDLGSIRDRCTKNHDNQYCSSEVFPAIPIS